VTIPLPVRRGPLPESEGSRREFQAPGGHGAAGLPPDPEEIFRDYAPRVYSLAYRMLGNATDAEDVTQDVFLQVVRNLATFRGDAAFPTWLHRVTVNAALGCRRKRARREVYRQPALLDNCRQDGPHHSPGRHREVGPEQEVLDHETRWLIEKAIAGLPAIYRDVYVLADVEQLGNADIAAMFGLSVPAVKSRLHRARLLMRAALAPCFDDQAT
jgi:RNA polymerase sigma-70 factor, ECF subfamily